MWIHPCTIAFKSAKQKKQNIRKYCILFTGSFLGCKHIQLLNDCKKDKAKIYQANQYMYIAKCCFNGRFIEKIGRNFNYLKIVTKGTYYFNSSCRCFTTKDRVMLSWHQAKAALSWGVLTWFGCKRQKNREREKERKETEWLSTHK